jgi:hypothetical protein
MRYEDPEPVEHGEAVVVFAGDDSDLISRTIVGLALHDPDGEWVEDHCWRLAEQADPAVRGAAGLCLGHIARRFGCIRPQSWSVARRLCDDPTTDSRPCDGLDDMRTFAGPEPDETFLLVPIRDGSALARRSPPSARWRAARRSARE